MKIKLTPRAIQTNFMIDIFSTNPINPMEVVRTKITGPISASEELTIRAFSTVLNLIMRIAANISMLPDINRKKAIPSTTFSMIINIMTSWKYHFYHKYMIGGSREGQVFHFH
jgi:hypothetical protein